MSLPPLGSLENQYQEGARGERPDPFSEHWHMMQELRRQYGEQIVGEARQVAEELRTRGVEPQFEFVIQDVEAHLEGQTPQFDTHVLGRYGGWRLVQAERVMPTPKQTQADYDFSPIPETDLQQVMYRGIALLADGRMVPYTTSSHEYALAAPDRHADESWEDESLELAVVQEAQIHEGEYQDSWAMHKDMRDENDRWPVTNPTWTLTTPGPDTQVYGLGIRSGLASLAQQNGITIS